MSVKPLAVCGERLFGQDFSPDTKSCPAFLELDIHEMIFESNMHWGIGGLRWPLRFQPDFEATCLVSKLK